MSTRNWGYISSGATFESLCLTLVRFVDRGAVLFGKPGKDGGQDARSGDGLSVFQAKYHQDGNTSKAIADAKSEAVRIARYRDPAHPRFEQWKTVTHWRLVTNVQFNPTDLARWNAEVVPAFGAIDLASDYWDRPVLNALLDRYPEVDRSFFSGETRAFLTIAEVRARMPFQEPFLPRAALGGFFGRESEKQQILGFLDSDALFLLVHGRGGLGKTRLLLEAGGDAAATGWQVLWANVATMTASPSWFAAIVPEQPTLLLVDEPDDDQLLRILTEQLGERVGRTAKWKVAVAIRSPKTPVLRFLRGPRTRALVQELELRALTHEAAEAMCLDLLPASPSEESQQRETAAELARRFSCHPIWLTLAVRLAEQGGGLARVPDTVEALAETYLNEVLRDQQHVPGETLLGLLRWIALLGTLNREDELSIGLLANKTGLEDTTTVRSILASLVSRGVLIQRGARNRLVELTPDVLRDHLLQRWLSVAVGYGCTPVHPSHEAELLSAALQQSLLGGAIGSVDRSILSSVARTELILRLTGRAVPLLDSFFSGIRGQLEQTSASRRLLIATVLVDVAAFRPVDVVEICRRLRERHTTSECVDGLFGSRSVGQDEIVLALAWPLYHAALGAQSSAECDRVLAEFCALIEEEARLAPCLPHGLPNDGKRAGQLTATVIQGGPQFLSSYDDTAALHARRLIDALALEEPTPARASAIQVVLETILSMDRHHSWSDDRTLQLRTFILAPEHPGWAARESTLTSVTDVLARDNVPRGSRRLLWTMLAKGHGSAIQCRSQADDRLRAEIHRSLVRDLRWAHTILSNRKNDIDDLNDARALWLWHIKSGKDAELRVLGEQLEGLYSNNALAREFGWLQGDDNWEDIGHRQLEKAAELTGPGAVDAFLDRATRFFGDEQGVMRLADLAWHLGSHAEASEHIRRFVVDTLAHRDVTPRTDFSAVLAAAWMATLRVTNSQSAYEPARRLIDHCGSDQQRVNLAARIYGALPRPHGLPDLSPPEHDYLRSLAELFRQSQRSDTFVACVAWSFHYRWPDLRQLLERFLDGVAPDRLAAATGRLVETLSWAVRGHNAQNVPVDLGCWLLDQVLRLPDVHLEHTSLGWRIKELLKHVPPVPLSWLPAALSRRREMETRARNGDRFTMRHDASLAKYVVKVDNSNASVPALREAISMLVNLATEKDAVAYYLPEILAEVDPDGLLVGGEVGSRINSATSDSDTVWWLARIAGGYPTGTPAWRSIAAPVLARALANDSQEERHSLFRAISPGGPRVWSGRPGEVPRVFVAALEDARSRLELDCEPAFRAYWEWSVAVAEAELRDQEEHAKEERGE